MGTFLRTWREEWARLSRAQLALAVSAQCECHHGKRIVPPVVREWERGQPPQTAEELEALSLVMRRHGLQQLEAEQFRDAVFAACLARQYPPLFPEEGLAHREDLDELAAAFFTRHHEVPGSANIVYLTVAVKELEAAVRGDVLPPASRAQQRRQQVGLGYLRGLLAEAHECGGRLQAAASAYSANAEALEVWFGPSGLGWPLLPLAQRASETHLRCYLAPSGTRTRPGSSSDALALRLLDLVEEAEAMGQERAGRWAFFSALDALRHHKHPALALCRARAPEYLAKAEHAGDKVAVEGAHFHLFGAAIQEGRLEEAERHLVANPRLESGDPWDQVVWQDMVGNLALGAGRVSEAMNHFEEGLRLARTAGGLGSWETALTNQIRACERRQRSRD